MTEDTPTPEMAEHETVVSEEARGIILKKARRYEQGQHFDLAIAEYQKIVQLEPNNTRILLKIGDLLAKTDKYEVAIATYEGVGHSYASEGFSVKAIAVYKQLSELIRKHVPNLAEQYGHVTVRLAELYQQLGLNAEALAAYDEHVTRLQQAGKLGESIEVFQKMIEISGNMPLTRLRLAEALVAANDLDAARDQYLLAAEILLAMGRKDDALELFDLMNDPRPSP